ncbi:MAG TPA: tetratricopeptide repeat protein, partial [Rhodanobacteraceae bacterium]|nr:tetratricopeptide repeat protein [Rhodanobacteraceae bacterium]
RRALAESQTGRHDAAIADYEAALAIRRKRLPPDDPEILNSDDALGNAYIRAGRVDDAIDHLRRAVDGAEARFGERHVKTAHYLKNLATAIGMQRRFAEAATLLERAVRTESELYPPGSPDVVNGLNNLGSLRLTLGQLHAAQETLASARERNRAAGLDASLGQTFVLGNLARVDEALGDADGAAALLAEAKKTATGVVGPEHARTLTLDLQAARLDLLRDPASAPAALRIASAILAHPERLSQFRARSEPEARLTLGLAEAAEGKTGDAIATWKEAVAALPADHVDPQTLPLIVALADAESANGDAGAAIALLGAYLERAGRELPTTHYAIGRLHLALAESLRAAGKPGARAELDAAAAAFAELPPAHPWRRRAEALLRQPAA